MNKQTIVVFFVILAAIGLITVVAVDIVLDTQEAEGKGCRTSQAVNASKGRCIKD
jgi:Flp pilus assembly protein CpaB